MSDGSQIDVPRTLQGHWEEIERLYRSMDVLKNGIDRALDISQILIKMFEGKIDSDIEYTMSVHNAIVENNQKTLDLERKLSLIQPSMQTSIVENLSQANKQLHEDIKVYRLSIDNQSSMIRGLHTRIANITSALDKLQVENNNLKNILKNSQGSNAYC